MSWIDFRKLRESLSFEQVLDHYGVELKIGQDKANGFCPLPSHKGERRSPSFSVQLAKGIFQCFGCHAKGNILDFACLMEGKDPRNGADVHEIARELHERFVEGGESDDEERRKPPTRIHRKQRDLNPPKIRSQSSEQKKPSVPVIVNAPLDFELKELDPDHPYLHERGFTPETIEHFGLGFCNRGSFKGRVVIPLHDAQGQFIGYCGRITSDKLISPSCPKYKFPGPREHEGQIHEFHKSVFLYNGHRITSPVDDLIVVEGFPSVWWLWQHGYKNVVSVMGSSCSQEQAGLIANLVNSDGTVLLMPDGNDAGRLCALSALEHLSPQCSVRWLKLQNDEQPTDLGADELAAVLHM